MQNHLQTKPTMQTNRIFAAQALDKKKWRNEETIIVRSQHKSHTCFDSLLRRCLNAAHPQYQIRNKTIHRELRVFNKTKLQEAKIEKKITLFKKWTRNSRREWTEIKLKDTDGQNGIVTDEKERTRGLKQKDKSTSLVVPPPFPAVLLIPRLALSLVAPGPSSSPLSQRQSLLSS